MCNWLKLCKPSVRCDVVLQQVWMVFHQPEVVPAQLYCSASAWVALRAHSQIYSGFCGHRHCVKAYPCPVVGFLPPLTQSCFCQQLGPALSKHHIFIPSLVSVLERFVEGDVTLGKAVPLYSTACAYVTCLSSTNGPACGCADVIYGVLCQIYQKNSVNYVYHVIFQVNFVLSFRKLILDCIFLIVCTNGARESG